MDRSPRIPANVQELTARRSVSATFVSRVQLAICRNEWALREARGVLHATAFSFCTVQTSNCAPLRRKTPLAGAERVVEKYLSFEIDRTRTLAV